MLIAITSSVYKITGNNHLWSNGITQNGIYLAMLLEKMKHRVIMIHNDVPKFKETVGLPPNLEIIGLDDLLNYSFDIIITLGHTLLEDHNKKYREDHPNCKFILYVCGNTFISTMENIIFRHEKNEVRSLPKYEYDQIWVVPQNEETENSYLRFFYNTPNVTVVPFIWSPYAGEVFMEHAKHKEYQDGKPIESIAILEPNLSVVKSFLMPLVIAEEYLRQDENFKYLYIFSAIAFRENKNLLENLSGTELLKTGKLSVEGRYPTISVLNMWADLVLSFQWKNPLNYLYLDVAWWGWPVVHNAELCKDIGYYYEGFDAMDGVSALKYAMKNHHLDTTYKSRMRQIIKRYTDDNPNLLDDYDRLLTNVVTGKFVKYKYNWRLNTIHS